MMKAGVGVVDRAEGTNITPASEGWLMGLMERTGAFYRAVGTSTIPAEFGLGGRPGLEGGARNHLFSSMALGVAGLFLTIPSNRNHLFLLNDTLN